MCGSSWSITITITITLVRFACFFGHFVAVSPEKNVKKLGWPPLFPQKYHIFPYFFWSVPYILLMSVSCLTMFQITIEWYWTLKAIYVDGMVGNGRVGSLNVFYKHLSVLKIYHCMLRESCYSIAHKWRLAMVTKLTNGSRFARSLPAILVNPPLWALSTELHRFILTQRHIHISHALISFIFCQMLSLTNI